MLYRKISKETSSQWRKTGPRFESYSHQLKTYIQGFGGFAGPLVLGAASRNGSVYLAKTCYHRVLLKKTCLPWHIYITKIQSLNEPHVNSIYNFWLSQVCMASQDHQPGNPSAVCPHVWQLGTCLFDRSKQHWRRPSEWRLGVRMRRWRKPPTRST